MGNYVRAAAAKIQARTWAGLTLALIATTMSAVTIAKAEGSRAPVAPNTACTSPSPCVTDTNHGKGIGVEGTAAIGTAGVKGTSTNGLGVWGASSGGDGVEGTSSSSVGVLGNSTSFYGVEGNSAGFYAAVGGYNTYTTAGASGVYGQSTNGPGVYGYSENSYAMEADGNVEVLGEIYTEGGCSTGCSRTRHETSFAARTSQPTIDDVGEAALRNGVAHVALSPDFANVIDPSHPYIVMLTPEGDASLYVASRNAGGFDVRQVGGGRNSIGFAYRIVAKPFGVRDERLPFHTNVPVH